MESEAEYESTYWPENDEFTAPVPAYRGNEAVGLFLNPFRDGRKKWVADGMLRSDRAYLADPEGVTIYKEKGKEPIVEKNTIDQLERQAARLLTYAQEMRDKIDRFGEDDYPDRAVIVFDKTFYKGGVKYAYSAIKVNGLWSTTGPKAPKSYTWDELINWMGDGVEEIYYVTKMERVV